jgi:peptide/nickel transport system substrate-binding protein
MKRTMKRMRVAVVAGAVLALAAACSSSSGGKASSSGSGKIGGVVTISNASGGLWTCGFNPFNPSDNTLSLGVVYEPLVFVNALKSGATTPWLASKYEWSADNKTLTFTIRSGVKWTDGQAMTADDVVYTFQLMKEHPALDLGAVWSVLTGVTKQGSDQVVMTFANPAVPYFYYIADQVGIVPQHIWSKISGDPGTYVDSNPVGTGPYTVNPCTPQNITYVRNPSYWQPGLPKIAKVLYPAYTSNDPANLDLATGKAQWGSQFIPDIDTFYKAKSPDHHYWFPPTTNVAVFPNLTVTPLDDPVVRQAMAYGIDREKVSKVAEYGYEPAANQSGIVTPTYDSWLDKGQASTYGYTYDVAKAQSLLQGAGYTKGSDGVYVSPSGKRLSFSIINIGDYSDWVASVREVTTDLKAVGIELKAENLSSDDYDNRLYNGKFDLAYGAETGGPTPFYEFRQWLYSKNSAPIGQQASSNWERYNSSATDALLDQYGSTTDDKTQHDIMNQLQTVLLKDVPVIPVTEGVDWYQYNTENISGWVTEQDPYAQPAAFVVPDMEVLLLHLQPK